MNCSLVVKALLSYPLPFFCSVELLEARIRENYFPSTTPTQVKMEEYQPHAETKLDLPYSSENGLLDPPPTKDNSLTPTDGRASSSSSPEHDEYTMVGLKCKKKTKD